MSIKIQTGDLLQQDTDAIVNTVNCAGIMGKGIALQFKRKWPENFKAYERACKSKQIKVGKMFVHDLGALDHGKPEFIINFPTKNHWREKSKLSYIETGLEDLVQVIRALNIKSISVPPLGCGNGGLSWEIVRPLIENALGHLNVEVRLFPPAGAPASREMVVRTEKPSMSIGRAVLLKLISIYREIDYSLSKIEIQKLCYFAQEAGEKLKLNYAQNQYGPYASNLRHVLNAIEGHYIAGVGDNDTAEPQITLVEGALEEAEGWLEGNPGSVEHIEKVAELIEGFETPYGMELLSTVHWVVSRNPSVSTKEEVVQAVYNWVPEQPTWNNRKRELMKEAHIYVALERLQQQGWANIIRQ